MIALACDECSHPVTAHKANGCEIAHCHCTQDLHHRIVSRGVACGVCGGWEFVCAGSGAHADVAGLSHELARIRSQRDELLTLAEEEGLVVRLFDADGFAVVPPERRGKPPVGLE